MKRSEHLIYDFDASPSGFESVKRPRVALDLGTIPMYERADLFHSNAGALNKAVQYDYKPSFLPEEEIYKIDEATFRYQVAAGAYMGGRLIREQDLPPFRWRKGPTKEFHRIPEQHILNVRSEAPHGLHGINGVVRSTVEQQKVRTTGASNSVRAYGFERDDNKKIYNRLPVGLPMSVEPQRSMVDADRINDKMVETISVFPGIGF